MSTIIDNTIEESNFAVFEYATEVNQISENFLPVEQFPEVTQSSGTTFTNLALVTAVNFTAETNLTAGARTIVILVTDGPTSGRDKLDALPFLAQARMDRQLDLFAVGLVDHDLDQLEAYTDNAPNHIFESSEYEGVAALVNDLATAVVDACINDCS